MIYIDSEFRCHINNPDGLFREFDVPFFSDKCDAVIECYRYVPPDETWVREDGEAFSGEMWSPWKDPSEFDEAQREYERQLFAEYEAALKVVGVTA